MLSIYNHIRNAINEEIDVEYERVVLFVHVMEGAASGFMIYNKPNSDAFSDVAKINKSIQMCENVWETEKRNGGHKLWSAIIYIIDDEGERYELLYDGDFDKDDLLNKKIGEVIEQKFFSNMSYKSP